MKTKRATISLLFFSAAICWLLGVPRADRTTEAGTFTDSLRAALGARTAEIFKRSCATAGCHAGAYPKARLSLEPKKMADAVLHVPSRQIDSLMLVDAETPHRSYLLMKIRGDEGIRGEAMPIAAPPLKTEEAKTIALWAASLAAPGKETVAPPGKKKP